uniref:Uncharacterized protein n=1 Tax=Nelumbo nucifera TaxID=4432 RepID=A0A822XH78_NELNU|nr:TPA_asm: hypothetical protein HUJ06_019819 [Nelumbo nucifera]
MYMLYTLKERVKQDILPWALETIIEKPSNFLTVKGPTNQHSFNLSNEDADNCQLIHFLQRFESYFPSKHTSTTQKARTFNKWFLINLNPS